MCGAVRYEAAGEPDVAPDVAHCHCESCRRHTGAPMVTLVSFERDKVRYTKGAPKIHNSSPGVGRAFCGDCGTPLTWEGVTGGKAVVEFHSGGTATLTSSASPYSTSHGSLKKMGKRTFVVSWYVIFTDEGTGEHVGYIKALVENTLVDKNTIEGRTEVWFLVGTDPFNPQDMFLVEVSEDLGRRLRAEGPS